MVQKASDGFLGTNKQILVFWFPSFDLWVNLIAKGGFRSLTKSSNCGWVLGDNSRAWLTSFVVNLRGSSNVTTKLWDHYHGLQLAKTKGTKKIY